MITSDKLNFQQKWRMPKYTQAKLMHNNHGCESICMVESHRPIRLLPLKSGIGTTSILSIGMVDMIIAMVRQKWGN